MKPQNRSRRRAWILWSGALVLGLALAGCGKKTDQSAAQKTGTVVPAGVAVTDVKIGRALGPDKRITDSTDQFHPAETIYASVETGGSAGSAALVARWTYEDGQVVSETTRTIAPTGPAVTEFEITRPSGWPKGKYKLEISLDGRPAASKEFTVTD